MANLTNDELRARGYRVEQITGEDWGGLWRWIHSGGEFQQSDPYATEDEAWEDAQEADDATS